MSEFDLNQISDEALRGEYRNIANRARAICEAVSRAYKGTPDAIEFRYVEGKAFNAAAKPHGERYQIEIHSAVPLFLYILFARLLSDPKVMPHIEHSGPYSSDFDLQAVVDPLDFEGRAEWAVRLGTNRAFIAGTLADICATFVLCHEVGHIMCGHADAHYAIDGQLSLHELVEREQKTQADFDRRQAWEVDADAFGVTLLMNYLAEFVALQTTDERAALLMPDADDPVPELLATTITALFAFFVYVQGARDALNLHSTHPHPMVRAHYIHDMVLSAASQRWDINTEKFADLFDERLDEMMIALEKFSLFDASRLSDEYFEEIAHDVVRLTELQTKMRPIAEQWAWVSWA